MLVACWPRAADAVTLGSADADDQSFANVDEFRTTHLELIIDVDFHNRELDGNAVLEMKRLDPKSTQLILDTQDLNILTVSELSADFSPWQDRPEARNAAVHRSGTVQGTQARHQDRVRDDREVPRRALARTRGTQIQIAAVRLHGFRRHRCA
jgi:aminopeptidase N